VDTLVGNMPLTLIDKYFRSPTRLFFECRGILWATPITIDKIEARLDFHIYHVINFDILLGYPLDKLLASQGSLDEKLRKTSFVPYLENPTAKPLPEQNPLEQMMHISLFISFELIFFDIAKPITSKGYDLEDTLHFCEDKRSSSHSIEFEPHPAGPECVVLDHDR